MNKKIIRDIVPPDSRKISLKREAEVKKEEPIKREEPKIEEKKSIPSRPVDEFAHITSNKADIGEKKYIDIEKGEEKESRAEAKNKKFSLKPFFSIFFLIALIGVGIFLFITLPKADIQIKAKTEIKTFNISLLIDVDASEINFENNVIPGTLFQEEEKMLEEFNSTGDVIDSQKATGTIRVYNEYTRDQPLVKNTRFQPPVEKFKGELDEDLDEEPYFRTTKSISVPSKGYVDVEVVADSPGAKYNIEPSMFSIPGLAGTAQYAYIHGESSEAMTGGFEERSNQITQSDIDNADKKIREAIIERVETILKNKISEEFEVVDNAIKAEVIETSTSVKPGMSLDKFNYRASAAASVVAFKKADLDAFVKKFLFLELSDEKDFNKDNLVIKYIYKSFLDGAMSIDLEIEAEVYDSENEQGLINDIKGSSASEAKIYLESKTSIDSARVYFWPFWVSSVPKNEDKIKIEWVF